MGPAHYSVVIRTASTVGCPSNWRATGTRNGAEALLRVALSQCSCKGTRRGWRIADSQILRGAPVAVVFGWGVLSATQGRGGTAVSDGGCAAAIL